jgi:hypothetical protein
MEQSSYWTIASRRHAHRRPQARAFLNSHGARARIDPYGSAANVGFAETHIRRYRPKYPVTFLSV